MNTKSKPVRIEYWKRRIYYICPKCGKPITFKKRMMGKSLCLKCGQRLDWSPENQIHTEMITAGSAGEATYIAEQYYSACGLQENDWYDLNELYKSLSKQEDQKVELYLLFKNPKEYGRFKRMIGGKNAGHN